MTPYRTNAATSAPRPAPRTPWWRLARVWATGRLATIEVRRLISNAARDASVIHNLPLGMLFKFAEEANRRPHFRFDQVLALAREINRRKGVVATSGGPPR